MKKILLTVILALGLVSSANAAELYIAHGINGADLGLTPSLPVDIEIDGGCRLTNVPFKTVSNVFVLPTRSYEIQVRLANGSCTGAIAGTTRVDLSVNEVSTLVAHLSSEGVVKFTKFINNLQATTGDKSRFTIRHAAAAPALDTTYRIRFASRVVRGLANGSQYNGEVTAGSYSFRFVSTETRRTVVSTSAPLTADENLMIYVVGSAKKGSLTTFIQRLMTAPN